MIRQARAKFRKGDGLTVDMTEDRAEELVQAFCADDEHLRYLLDKSELKPVIIAILERLASCERTTRTGVWRPVTRHRAALRAPSYRRRTRS